MQSIFYGLAGAFAGVAVYGLAMLFPEADFAWEWMAALVASFAGIGILKGA